MLLAEDLLLLLTDDDSGKLAASGAEVDVALGGALLVELALMERVDIAGPDESVREGRLLVRNPGPTGDGLLDETLAAVGDDGGQEAAERRGVTREGRAGAALRASGRGWGSARGGGPDPGHLPDSPLAVRGRRPRGVDPDGARNGAPRRQDDG